MSTSLIEHTDEGVVEQITTSTDKPESAHIIVKVPSGEDDETPHAYVMRARVEGFPIVALCGYTWVPNKMATGLPVCAECKDIYENDPLGHGDRGDLPDE